MVNLIDPGHAENRDDSFRPLAVADIKKQLQPYVSSGEPATLWFEVHRSNPLATPRYEVLVARIASMNEEFGSQLRVIFTGIDPKAAERVIERRLSEMEVECNMTRKELLQGLEVQKYCYGLTSLTDLVFSHFG